MKSDTTVVRFRQPEAVDDPLTEHRAERCATDAGRGDRGGGGGLRGAPCRASGCRTGGSAWCAMGTGRKRDPDRDRAARGAAAQGARPSRPARRPSGSGSRPRSCRAGRAVEGASMRCCRSSTCGASRLGDFQEALARLLGTDAPNLSPSVIARLKGGLGGRTRRAGSSATSRHGATSTSGPTAFTCRPGWSRTGRVHAGGDRRHAGGQEGTAWASRSACVRAPRAGGSCWST